MRRASGNRRSKEAASAASGVGLPSASGCKDPMYQDLLSLSSAPEHRSGAFLCSIRLPIPSWAHPHSRGENCSTAASVSRSSGSSPLTRGKLAVPDAALRRGGLIPAHTGKHGGQAGLEVAAGLIPAHAGKTMVGLAAARACWAHPRSRGENAPHLGIQANGPGSSPLMRGKPEVALADCVPVRLIPTHAGKTFVSHLYCAARGSSPLTRGKHRAVRRAGRQRGLIPAHAGKP